LKKTFSSNAEHLQEDQYPMDGLYVRSLQQVPINAWWVKAASPVKQLQQTVGAITLLSSGTAIG
jgi:hypothetical protein